MLEARERLIQAVLRLVASERSEPHAHYGDELDYCHDMILEAAQGLAATVGPYMTFTAAFMDNQD